MGAERVVEPGSRMPARTRASRERGVDVDQLVQPAEVERHGGLPAAALRRDPADHARAAAERDHGRAGLGACGQHTRYLVMMAGCDDDVGRVLAGARP